MSGNDVWGMCCERRGCVEGRRVWGRKQVEECYGDDGVCFDLQICFLCCFEISMLSEEIWFCLAEIKNMKNKMKNMKNKMKNMKNMKNKMKNMKNKRNLLSLSLSLSSRAGFERCRVHVVV